MDLLEKNLFSFEVIDLSELRSLGPVNPPSQGGCSGDNGSCGSDCGCGGNNGNCGK